MNYHKKSTQQGYAEHQIRTKVENIRKSYKMNPSRAKHEILTILKIEPRNMYAKQLYGQICEEMFDYKEAEKAYTEVANSNSSNKHDGFFSLAELAKKKGDLFQAKRYYWKSIKESKGKEKMPIYHLARLEKADGNYEEALYVLSLLKEQTFDTDIERIKIYGAWGKFNEALEFSKKIKTSSEAEKRTINLEMAIISSTLGYHPAAMYYFQEAKQKAPQDAIYHKTLLEEAKVLYSIGDLQGTINNCEELSNAGETIYGYVHYLLGRAKQELGEYTSALVNYRIAKSNAEPGQTLSMIQLSLGSLGLAMGDGKLAEENLVACKEFYKKNNYQYNMNLIVRLFSTYLMQGKYQEAKDLIAEARKGKRQPDEINQLDLATFIVAKKMNEPLPDIPISYREKQIVSYSKQEAINHIKARHQGELPGTSNFSKDIDIEKLYQDVKIQLCPENRDLSDILERHYIDYPNVGYNQNGEIVNKIYVVVIPGTTDIITMYPDSGNKFICQGEITRELDKNKSKSSDRISKFNARFAKANK